MIRYVVVFWIAAAFVLIAPAAHAGCQHLFRAHHVQQVAVVQPLYFAGQATQDEALIRKAIRAEAPAILREALQQLQAAPQAQTAPQSATFSRKCASCHKGDKSLSGDAETFKAFARMAGLGEGIPAPMKSVIAGLTAAEKGELTEHFLRMPAKPDPQVVIPPPEESGLLQ